MMQRLPPSLSRATARGNGWLDPNKALIIVGRFLSGLGASVTFGVQMGTLSDCWRAENRGKSVAILGFAPLLGPALGPIFGGLIVQSTSWRWIFWSIALFNGALQVLAWLLFSETYAPVLLARKAHKLRHSTGNNNFYTAFETTPLAPRQRLANSLVRPLRIIVTHAAARTITVYGCVSFGTLYIILSDFASLWIERYQQSANVGGLHYLAIVLGFLTAVVVGARFMDRTWQCADTPTPELRVFFVMPGGARMAAGLLVYGRAARNKLHWIVPDLGVAIFGLGAQLGTMAATAYLTNAYGQYAASASAGSFAVRSLCAVAFPLFGPQIMLVLGYGWGNSLLAGVCALAAVVVYLLLYSCEARWRAAAAVVVNLGEAVPRLCRRELVGSSARLSEIETEENRALDQYNTVQYSIVYQPCLSIRGCGIII